MKQYLTIDIGGTFIKYSVMNEAYEQSEEGSIPTSKVPSAFLQQLKQLVTSYRDKIDGIAMCMAGFIDPVTGMNTDFSIGANFKAYNLKKEIAECTGLPVFLENDSNCAAIGEMVKGSGKDCKNFCMVTIGTGIGGAFVINGELYRGSNFKAGELGLTRIGVSRQGEMQGAQATAGLVRQVSEFLGKSIDGAYVLEHLEEEPIRKLYKEWLEKAAMIIGNIAVSMDPERVLVGGGISENPVFMTDIREAVYKIYGHLQEYTQIVPCEKGNLAGRIGALYLFQEHTKKGACYK